MTGNRFLFAWFALPLVAVALPLALGAAQQPAAAPQPNLAQQSVNAAMLEECKGAAHIRFQQALVGQPIDVEGFRKICIKLRDCRDKLYAAVAK